ncbi:MAG TPA: ribose-phosphate pyrophosphokinase-like domain-containing protein, partial [Nitrososphaeraceae archaeon]|nr:ribose-phosphate pyrophosphokinase-like domain-containing protein [Nitrososphaeraceae archaeon]
MEIKKNADLKSSRQSSMLSPEVIIGGPSSLSLATLISRAMGLSMICPELRIFSDGESKIRIKEKLRNKTCIIV